jgi:hypothetical protein
MKNLNLLFSILFFFTFGLRSFAQDTLPNSDFENWVSTEKPVGWDGANIHTTYMTFPVNIVTTQKSTHYFLGGLSCVKMETTPTFGTFPPAPGFLTLGKFWFTISPMNGGASGGIAFTGRPDSLRGWYQATPVGNDRPMIFIVMWKGTNTYVAADTSFLPATATWKQFAVPIHYYLPDNPDSLNIIIGCSDIFHQANIQAGSVMYVDHLFFGTKENSIKENGISKNALNIYPNPASGKLNIALSNFTGDGRFIIYNSQGQKMHETMVNSSEAIIDIEKIKAGIYYYKYFDRVNNYSGTVNIK